MSDDPMPPRRPQHPTDPRAVQAGHIMTLVHFARVRDVQDGGDRLTIEDLDTGQVFEVQGHGLVSSMASADAYAETVKVSATRLAELLTSAHNRPLTVCFVKADGEVRTLRGRFLAHEAMLGRSYCEDLDLPANDRIRLVDHRTLQWLIVDGIRYERKA